MIWDWDYPFGQANVQTWYMIDFDDSGMKIEVSNPHFGKAVSFHHRHIDGADNCDQKLNLILTMTWSGMSIGSTRRVEDLSIGYTHSLKCITDELAG